MMHHIPILILILYFAAPQLSARQSSSEQKESRFYYLKVDYFKAAGPQISDYLDVELDLWKPIHRERFNRGIIKSWDFYSVVAGGHDIPYNFIAVNVFDDFSMIDYFDLENIVQAVYPGMDTGKMLDRTRNSREVVRTEIWKVNKRMLDKDRQSPGGNYLTIQYFSDSGITDEEVENKMELLGPVHQVRIDQNVLNSWAIHTLLFPGGKAREYSYCTVEYYDQLGDLRVPADQSLADTTPPELSDEDISDYISSDYSTGALVKTELWKRIGHVGPDEN